MIKTPTTQLAEAVRKIRTAPIALVSLELSPTVRYTTHGTDIIYDGNTYSPQNFTVRSPTLGNDGSSNASITFEAISKTFISVFRSGVEGSNVDIWITERLASYSDPNDADHMISSQIDQVILDPDQITLQLARQILHLPFEKVDAENGFTDVTPPGPIQIGGGQEVLS